ncbi:MAG: bifunctional oligoribonuclease and phosphatase NrnA [Thermotogaceae bacterium]|jgi:phosphoesterase RecJ-like protein|nr:bifunctional oligoribonuclease and phosphatase NrnA [Thermotogaceae bacterium]
MEVLNEILNLIKQSNKIIVTGHIMPDGDCISSVLSLSIALEKVGKDVLPVIDYDIPYQYQELVEVQKIKKANDVIREINECDLIIILDSSSVDRIGKLKDFLENKKKIVIDHHVTNEKFGDVNWVGDFFSSTAQMIYRLNQALGVEYDSRLSTINLMGIATDTGFFRYPNTTSEVFKDAYELSKRGGEIWPIAQMILENNRPERLKLFANTIEKMEFLLDGKFVHSIIRYEDFKRFNCKEEDSSGFVGELRAIKGVEVAVLVVEYPKGKVHVSMRSKNEFDVSTIASELGGGGHPRAAGCTFDDADPDEIRKIVVNKISEALSIRG